MGVTYQDVVWSHSALSAFLECPQKYYREKVTKEVPFVETQALIEGRKIHDLLEDVLRGKKKTMPKPYQHLQPLAAFADSLPKTEPEKELALKFKDGKLVPCAWFDEKTWARCKIDVVSTPDPTHKLVVDWKTGKYWGPDQQPERTAAFLFWYYPEVEVVSTVWYYMKPEPDKKIATFTRKKDQARLTADIIVSLNKIAAARNNQDWTPTPGRGCRFCGYSACPHYQGG